MLPLLLLVGVPSAAGSCYVMWGQGQQMALRTSSRLEHPPSSSVASYVCGVGTLIGAYAGQGQLIRKFEGSSTPSSAPAPYQQPQNVVDALRRMGKPALLHVGAASMAFFCAGLMQTYVTCLWDKK
jgi:hypothetical protein